MLEQLTKLLQGEVELRVESAFPERVLNLCAARGIALWDVRWREATAFSCRLTRRDHRRLRQAAKNLDCTLTVERSRGVPFLLGKARRRQVLLTGVCTCLGLLLIGSLFVLDFEIEGNTTVPDEEILRSLEKNGVHLGTFGLSVDSEDLRNHVLLDIPELGWIAVNVSGYRAHVQVRERVPKPEIWEKKVPTNIVATRDGLVVRIQALEGDKQVLPGTTVEEGQILISGVEDLETTGARMLTGMGQVWARTWRELTATVPLEAGQKVYTGKERTRFALILGKSRIKFYGNGSIDQGDYDKISRRSTLTLPGGLHLPVTLVWETYRPYETVPVPVTPTQAESQARALLLAHLSTLIGEDGTISSAVCSSREKDGRLTVTLRAECVEQIGRPVEIPTGAE